MLSPGPGGGKGGVVTWSQGGREVLSPGPKGGRCCHLVPGGGREGGVVTWSWGGGEGGAVQTPLGVASP